MSDELPGDEVLRRQVHPNSWHPAEPKIDSSAFTPRASEVHGRISCLRGRVTPEEAWRRYANLGLQSAGTFGVSVEEARQVDCPSGDDSDEPDRPKDHAFIELRGSKKQVQRKARALATFASGRGILHTNQYLRDLPPQN